MAIAAICCLLLVSLALLDWERSHVDAYPTSGKQSAALPDRIYEPSKWLPGTDGEPFDRLIAILPATRGSWFGSSDGWVGVSATSGEYRFLDLPDAAGKSGESVALSPDGRQVAYWTGPGGNVESDEPPGMTGYAVYDVERGVTTLMERVESEEGLMPYTLGWVDDEGLAVSYYFLKWQGAGVGYQGVDPERWIHDTPTGDAEPWRDEIGYAAGGGWIGDTWGGRSTTLRAATSPDRRVRLRGESGFQPLAHADGTRFVGLLVKGARTQPNPLAVAHLAPGAELARFREVPGDTLYNEPVGWRDDHTVVAVGWRKSDRLRSWEGMGLYAVDVRSGQRHRLSELDSGLARFATGLLDSPVESRPAPPRPLGPWTRPGLAALVLVVGVAGLIGWRRRVRP